MWEVILEALTDSAMALPILFIVYFLIELLEHKGEVKFEKIVASSKKYGPLWGSALGCIPQCGFSAVMADLYSRKMITIGTLIAVFIATSDEAFALLLSSSVKDGNNILSLLILIGLKIVLSIFFGFMFDLIFKHQTLKEDNIIHEEHKHEIKEGCTACEDTITHNEHTCENCTDHESHCENCVHNHLHHKHEFENEHNEKKSKIFWHILLQTLLHTLEIFGWILLANLVIGILLEVAGGEEVLKTIMGTNAWYQPIVCALIGLIPNCAGSVALVELYTGGIISFASCLGGLCTGAGIGLIVLYRKNKNIKENLFITASVLILGILVGLIFNLFMPLKI